MTDTPQSASLADRPNRLRARRSRQRWSATAGIQPVGRHAVPWARQTKLSKIDAHGPARGKGARAIHENHDQRFVNGATVRWIRRSRRAVPAADLAPRIAAGNVVLNSLSTRVR